VLMVVLIAIKITNDLCSMINNNNNNNNKTVKY